MPALGEVSLPVTFTVWFSTSAALKSCSAAIFTESACGLKNVTWHANVPLPLPIDPELADALLLFRRQAVYVAATD